MSLSKLLATMINRVQGIDYLIFSIVPRGKERRRVERDRNNRCRMSSTIASIAIFFPSLSSFYFSSLSNFLPFLPPPIFLFSSVPSPRFIHPLPLLSSCCFRSRIFRQQGLVLFRPRATLIVNSTAYQFFFFFPPLVHTEANDGFLRSMENENAFFVRFYVYIYMCVCAISAIRDFVSGKQWDKGGGNERFVIAFSLIFLPASLV